ncbi:iron ABC transporter permease [Rhodobacterales bacterium]|nr:iron ABC transporter permease [Rhodobacterales bacterium]
MTSLSRMSLAVSGTAFVLLAVAGLSVTIGTWPLDWSSALSFTGMDATVLWDFRAPRILAALLGGACLGLSGSIFQTMLRNPLASPDIIGFTAGSSAGALLTIVLSGGTAYVVVGALGGGLMTGALVMSLAWRGGLDPFRLVLIGLAFGISLMALTNFLLGISSAPQAADAARWLAGSFSARGWDAVLTLGLTLLCAAPLLAFLRFTLDRLDLGDDLARLLGLPVDAARVGLALVAIALAAAAVSVAGPIAFVAFMAPPTARALAGSHGACLVLSALAGSAITLAADFAARFGIAGYHLPAGVFTALIGGPFLLGLVILQTRRNRL